MVVYRKFNAFIEANGYSKTSSDHCVFVKKLSYSDFWFSCYMLTISHDVAKIEKLKSRLNKSFTMKDLGSAKQILWHKNYS